MIAILTSVMNGLCMLGCLAQLGGGHPLKQVSGYGMKGPSETEDLSAMLTESPVFGVFFVSERGNCRGRINFLTVIYLGVFPFRG